MSIRAFEKGGEMRESNLRFLRLTFEAAGVAFQDEGEMVACPMLVGKKSFVSIVPLQAVASDQDWRHCRLLQP
ncbi:hypothetical protein ASE47_24220 [Ensifer sp. Root258]|nr:hypothetical protein ASE47_24220 [Ensifer sp. Root258]